MAEKKTKESRRPIEPYEHSGQQRIENVPAALGD